jgi:hypothetical protein
MEQMGYAERLLFQGWSLLMSSRCHTQKLSISARSAEESLLLSQDLQLHFDLGSLSRSSSIYSKDIDLELVW